ncbi:MAG: hypothetical protein ABSF69_21070 [Polyangiaceae bacterium]|jgi:hypothetical protein
MRLAAPWIALTAALSIGAPRAAGADNDPAVRDAQARFEEGIARVKGGDYEAARISFAQAYAVLRRPAILWNLALAEEKTEHWVDALDHFKRVARDAQANAADREDAQRHADRLMARTGHIDVQAPPGSTLRVDGDAITGVAPFPEPLDVVPGHHQIDARLADSFKSVPVDVAAGQIAHVSFASVGATDTAPASASEATNATPSAPVPPSIDTAITQSNPSVADGRPSPSPARAITVSALGAGAVVAAGIGVYLGLASQSDANHAATDRSQLTGNSSCFGLSTNPSCTNLNDAVRAENRAATGSTTLYVTAAILAAGAVATWFLWPKGENGPQLAWILPEVTPCEVGIRAEGNF